jgi:hypothetical protein
MQYEKIPGYIESGKAEGATLHLGYGGLLGHFSKKPFSVPLAHRSCLQVM